MFTNEFESLLAFGNKTSNIVIPFTHSCHNNKKDSMISLLNYCMFLIKLSEKKSASYHSLKGDTFKGSYSLQLESTGSFKSIMKLKLLKQLISLFCHRIIKNKLSNYVF